MRDVFDKVWLTVCGAIMYHDALTKDWFWFTVFGILALITIFADRNK